MVLSAYGGYVFSASPVFITSPLLPCLGRFRDGRPRKCRQTVSTRSVVLSEVSVLFPTRNNSIHWELKNIHPRPHLSARSSGAGCSHLCLNTRGGRAMIVLSTTKSPPLTLHLAPCSCPINTEWIEHHHSPKGRVRMLIVLQAPCRHYIHVLITPETSSKSDFYGSKN